MVKYPITILVLLLIIACLVFPISTGAHYYGKPSKFNC